MYNGSLSLFLFFFLAFFSYFLVYFPPKIGFNMGLFLWYY